MQDLRFLVLELRWNQDVDRLADDFRGSIAEEPLRPRVPGLDDAVEVLAHDGVIRRPDNRGELLRGLIKLSCSQLRAMPATQDHSLDPDRKR